MKIGNFSHEINNERLFNERTKNSPVVERVGYNNNREKNRGHVLLKGNSFVKQRGGRDWPIAMYTHAPIRIQSTSTVSTFRRGGIINY